MIKYIAMLFVCAVSVSTAYADDDLSLIDLFGEETKKQDVQKSEKQETWSDVESAKKQALSSEKETDDKEKVDDEGVFSFLNFSFLRKDKTKELARKNDEPQESYEERINRLANEGDVDACLTLGYMYLYGENGLEQDAQKAFQYYWMAAEKNDKIALNNLGSLYFSGIGVKKDKKRAVELFENAAQLGNNEASINLAFVYLTSVKNIDANMRSTIVRLFNQAAEGGNITGQYMMSMIYYNGYGIAKNDERAFVLLKKAAEQYDEAQYQLALRYMNAEGTPRNYKNAVANLVKAAKQGHIPSMVWLGDILSAGTSYPKNEYEAYIWYNIASVYDAPNVAEKRDILEQKLKIEEVLQAQETAESFKSKPTAITDYVHRTFGVNLADYVSAPQK